MSNIWVGIGIYVDRIVIHEVGWFACYPNKPDGIARVVERLALSNAVAIFAATTGHDGALVKALKAAQIPWVRVKKSRIRAFARGFGFPPGTAELSPILLRELGPTILNAAIIQTFDRRLDKHPSTADAEI